MGILDLFRRKAEPVETRASGTGYTAQLIGAREAWIRGGGGLAEMTSTVQACVGLWESALATADVEGAPQLTRPTMALLGRSLALRGEFVGLLRDGQVIPASDWDLSTRNGRPRAYRLSIPEAGGGRSETALAAEVFHVAIGAEPSAPWSGVAPLRRARLSAELLEAIETALAEAWREAPVGSQVVPFPESPDTDMEALARDFRGRRGRVLIRESVNVAAAGGAAPNTDWKPQDVTPDMSGMAPVQTLEAARGAVCLAFGVLPAMLHPSVMGPAIREVQRHLAQWTLEPVAKLVAAEASDKLGLPVRVDVVRPLQAYDAGGKARALSTIIEATARAKEAGLSPGEFAAALKMLDIEG
jgi:hypothetical protein